VPLGLTRRAFIISALTAGLLSGCAHVGDPPLASTSCTDSKSLHQAVWGHDGIVRRQALSKLEACGPEHWDLRALMAPLPELSYDSASEAWINLFTGLDPQSVEEPERMTDFLLVKASDPDGEVRRLAVYGLGLLLESQFPTSSLVRSQPKTLRALNDPNPGVRQAAAEAFIKKHFEFGFRYHNGVTTQASEALRSIVLALAKRSDDPDAGVRASVVSALTDLSRLDTFDGVKEPLVFPEELFDVASHALEDPTPPVREAALTAFTAIPSDQLTQAQQEQIQRQRLRLVNDPDDAVKRAAIEGLKEKNLPAMLSEVSVDNSSAAQLLAVLDALRSNHISAFPETNLVQSFLLRLLSHPDILIQLKARQMIIDSTLETDYSQYQSEDLLELYTEALDSENPIVKLEAILGLSDIASRSAEIQDEVIGILSPSLGSPLKGLRWAAALSIAEMRPTQHAVMPILEDILRDSSDPGIRKNTQIILGKIETPDSARILSETAWQESRVLLYVRSCNVGGFNLPAGQAHIAVEAMNQPECRRAIAESLYYLNPEERSHVALRLIRAYQSDDTDVRFNAVYALGGLLNPAYGELDSDLREELSTQLLSITQDEEEHPEVRRVAATMLHLHQQPMPEFFANTELSLPDLDCPNPMVRRSPGFVFDPYEGRCLYDTRTGCGDGLPQIYDALRNLLSRSDDQ